jgi:chemotaxis protein methyltransferase WspC
MDISEEALSKARIGFYGRGSFRGKDLTFRDRYFQPKNHGYQLLGHVSDKVRFKSGNVMENRFAAGAPYDVIFCRNLMIYMSAEARNQTLETMSRLLAETGIFFCGHAERQTAIDWGFEAVNETGVFACRKRCRKSRGKDPSVDATRAQFKRQVHEKKIEFIRKPLMPVDVVSIKSTEQQNRSKPDMSAPKPDTAVNLFLDAREMADQGQLPKALELCEVFIGENPLHVEAHFLMGLIHEALHNENKAEAFYNRAIYLNPEHVEALNHLAFIELQRGNKNSAERLRQRAQRISETGGRIA